MKYFPYKYNEFLFQQGKNVISSFDDYDWNISGISTNNTARNGARPKYSGVILGGAVKVVSVTMNDLSLRESMVIALDASGTTQNILYSTDEFGRMWYLYAKCTAMTVEGIDPEHGTASFGFVFEIDDPTWIAVDEVTDTWNVTTDGELHTITIGGNQPTNPVIEMTAGAPVGYYPNVWYIKNYNPISLTQIDGIDITNGGWDTAALILAGDMLSDGADIRVIMDGAEIPFWFGGGGINSATTKIFIRGVWLPGQFAPLRTALAGSGTPARIEWKVTATVKNALKKLPAIGTIRVGNEEISYKNLDATLCQADIVSREVRGTSIAVHSIGDNCWWVEHDIRIIYGNTTAEAPVYSDDYKPIFDLASSTLDTRVYTVFADANNIRPGSFIRMVLNDGIGKLNRVYSGNHAALVDVDPATDMGMEIASYQVQGKAKPETASLAWQYYHPAEITSVTTDAEKYKEFATTTWPATVALMSSADGVKFAPEWNETTPASAATWTTISHTTAEAIAAGKRYIRYQMAGSINALLSNFSRFEIHGVTIVLKTANVIQVGMQSEQSNYQFAVQIYNQTTDQSLFIDYPVEPGETLVIDSQGMTVIYKGINAIRSIGWDAIRTNWLPFVPGENVLQYFADPTGDVAIVLKTHDRAL